MLCSLLVGTLLPNDVSAIRKATSARTTLLVQYSLLGHSLHCSLNAPPTASQASVPGVASEAQTML